MSAITHTQTAKVVSESGTSLSASANEVGTSEINIDVSLPASTTDYDLVIAFNYANLQSIILLSDQNLMIQTNSGSAPDNTINLVAGRPLIWSKSSAYFSNLFTANVTHFYLTCTPAARLRGRLLLA